MVRGDRLMTKRSSLVWWVNHREGRMDRTGDRGGHKGARLVIILGWLGGII